MTPQLSQVAQWMDTQHRVVRYAPVTKIPNRERIDTVEAIVYRLNDFVEKVGVNVIDLRRPVLSQEVKTGPEEILAALSALHVQVLAAYHTFGLGEAMPAGVYELLNESVEPGAGPKRHTPDFAKVLRDVYSPKEEHTD